MGQKSQIRVRFAPSPTGFLHVGGLRTALYNYLFARKNDGIFVLRVEDTDRSRFVAGAVESLIDTLGWCGLECDEGPGKGGKYGPYIQSERLAIYRENIGSLLASKKAYYCFCPPGRIDELRKEQQKVNQQTKYDKYCLNLPPAEVSKKLNDNIPHVVRLNVEPDRMITVEDIIRGRVEFDSDLMDDQVLMKSDGYPTYHLANVIDDHLMKISHVIRGEEWLPSTPKHVLLYEAFGWDPPIFAHLPLLLNRDKSKLSKRQGDVAVEEYRAKGYLNEALLNFVALLGWNPGTEQEIFRIDELIDHFSLDAVNKSGAVFNIEKLNWLNYEHLRNKSDHEVLSLLKDILPASKYKDVGLNDTALLGIIDAMRPRITFIKDIIDKSPYFFEPPVVYDKDAQNKYWEEETGVYLSRLSVEFSGLNNPSKTDYESALKRTAEALGITNGELIHPVRLAISGVGGGPGLYDILFILGKEESVRRINRAVEKLK